MKNDSFIALLDNKKKIQQVETAELKSIIEEFPYFQAARSLHLKGLKNQDSFKYNKELKVTAAYTADRTVLFDYITSKVFLNEDQNIHQQIESKILDEIKPIPKVVEAKSTELIEANENLEIGKPIAFHQSENYSFNQWLQISTKKPVIRTSEKTEKSEIIESFIENNPKIEPLPKGKNLTVSVSKNEQDASLMTETLAKVYLEQKKYENAKQAYRILSLKYPEKSGFFADQIKRVQILQKHK